MTKWVIELGMYDISIKPRTTKKGVLVDFVSKYTTQAKRGINEEKLEEENEKKKKQGKCRMMEPVTNLVHELE